MNNRRRNEKKKNINMGKRKLRKEGKDKVVFLRRRDIDWEMWSLRLIYKNKK